MIPAAKIRIEKYNEFPVAVIEFMEDVEVLSSCIQNGGLVVTRTITIVEVPHEYFGNPSEDCNDVCLKLKLPGNTVIFLTATEVDRVISDVEDDNARAIVTAGLSNHVVAGEEITDWESKHKLSMERREKILKHAGTINIIGIVGEPLTDSAKANAIIAVTEAKTAAMNDLGFKETGTTSDAVAIVCPIGRKRNMYCGTGPGIGLSLSRAVRACVRQSLIKRGDFPYDMPETEIAELRRKFQ